MESFVFVLFAIVSVINLISYLLDNNKKSVFYISAVSKCLLMPILLVLYVLNANAIFLPIVFALILGFIGDVFLLDIKNLLRFRIGLVCFLLGHVAYIIAFIGISRSFNITALVVSIIMALIFIIVMYKVVHPNWQMKIAVVAYEILITTMTIFAFQVFLTKGIPHGVFVFAGSLLFLTSDSILARFTFVKQPKYGAFLVMLTYIAAQFLIVFGFI